MSADSTPMVTRLFGVPITPAPAIVEIPAAHVSRETSVEYPIVTPELVEAADQVVAEWECSLLGHALHTIAGEVQNDCLRCDAWLTPDQIAAEFYRMEGVN